MQGPGFPNRQPVAELMRQADARAVAGEGEIETPAGVPIKLSDINGNRRIRAIITKRGRFRPEVRKALEAQGHEIYPMPCSCTGKPRAVRRACRGCTGGLIEQAQ